MLSSFPFASRRRQSPLTILFSLRAFKDTVGAIRWGASEVREIDFLSLSPSPPSLYCSGGRCPARHPQRHQTEQCALRSPDAPGALRHRSDTVMPKDYERLRRCHPLGQIVLPRMWTDLSLVDSIGFPRLYRDLSNPWRDDGAGAEPLPAGVKNDDPECGSVS